MAPTPPHRWFARLHAETAGAGRHRRGWIAVALALLAAGLAGSALAAHNVAGTDSGQAHRAFLSSAEVTAAALTASLQHEEDLVVSARAYLSGDREGPNETQRGFQEWVDSVEALTR